MISVIVPVYNAEEYLEECLESIKNQTYTNIEVILVNDGSTDGSKEICEQYCEKDNRFKLVNQENQGQSVARNLGVAESVGQFIMFVDSDDVVRENIVEVLLSYMKEDVDLVECNLVRNQEELKMNKTIRVIFEGNSTEAIMNCISFKKVKFCPVTKLYRREIVEKVSFLEGFIYEDVYTGINYLRYIRKMVVIDYIGYYYRVHYLKDGINKKSPYVDLYEDFIRNAAFIAKQSKEVVQKYRLLRLYLFAPRYYTTFTHPIYTTLQKRWIATKKVMNHLNDKLHIGKN